MITAIMENSQESRREWFYGCSKELVKKIAM